jgi:hypothetical protein
MTSETKRLFLEAAGVVVALATTVAAVFFAWRGLGAWRRKMRGQDEYALAKRLLRAAHEVGASIDASRNSVDFASEEQRRARVEKTYKAFRAALLDAEVLWGDEFQASANSLVKCVSTWRGSWNQHLQPTDNDPEGIAYAAKLLAQPIIRAPGNPEKDEFGTEVRQAIAGIVEALEPYIGRK